MKGRGARRGVLNSTRNRYGRSELNTKTIPYIFKIATVNINGISADTRMLMLEVFLYKNDIDIVLLQEVTLPNITAVHRYTAHINIGTEGRGTAILMKAKLTARNVKRSHTDRGIALEFNRMWIINVYATSGAERKTEREAFFNKDLPLLLPPVPTDTMLAGDFNCIFNADDSTGRVPFSKALQKTVAGLGLYDAWDTEHTVLLGLHHGSTGYMSPGTSQTENKGWRLLQQPLRTTSLWLSD
jgi:endonuclease/exonuclease/phosphatase family metal-dependent hydrolase